MEPDLRDRLLFLNPWQLTPSRFSAEIARRLPQEWIPRHAQAASPSPQKALLVIGPRQAGKSSWVWHSLQAESPGEVLLLDCEEPLVRAWCRSAAAVMADLEAFFPAVRTLFLEEAHHLDEAGLFIKGLVDLRRQLRIVVTGSSSYHLAAKTRESLAGRATRRRILPFSLGEVLAQHRDRVPAARAQLADQLVARQWVYGGYPAVHLAQDPEAELGELLEAFVLRDVSDRFRVQRPDAFRKLVQLAAGQVGSLINQAEWAASLGISAQTVSEYLNLLEDAWIVRRVPPFAGGGRSEITRASRVHFVDSGLRNAALGAFSNDLGRRQDRGALAEGWVYGELLKTLPEDWTIHFWRTKGGAEMDFVVTHADRIIGIEVKAGSRDTLTRSTKSFIEAYAPEAILLVSARAGEISVVGRTAVHRVAFVDLATRLQELIPVALPKFRLSD